MFSFRLLPSPSQPVTVDENGNQDHESYDSKQHTSFLHSAISEQHRKQDQQGENRYDRFKIFHVNYFP